MHSFIVRGDLASGDRIDGQEAEVRRPMAFVHRPLNSFFTERRENWVRFVNFFIGILRNRQRRMNLDRAAWRREIFLGAFPARHIDPVIEDWAQ